MTTKMNYLILLLILIHQTNCFLEDIKESLGSAKMYLDQVLPMISDGLKAVKKFEEFVDNTIEEDCYFECPRGQKLLGPKQEHVRTSNGCGSLDVIFDDSENSLLHVEKEFSVCCDEHDVCYDTCGEDKDLCDLTFRKCLYRTDMQATLDSFEQFSEKAATSKTPLSTFTLRHHNWNRSN